MKLAGFLMILLAMASVLATKPQSQTATKAQIVDTCYCDSNCLRHGDCCWYCT
jgi:hypothetical protein